MGNKTGSEIAMGNDSCRLIAQNLFGFVENPYTSLARFNFDEWYKAVRRGMRLMDDLVDLEIEAIDRILAKIESDPEPDYIKAVEIQTWKQLRETGLRGRRTGLGITALGDTLAALGVSYSSQEALDFTDQMSRTKLRAELDEMIEMAKERGAFPAFNATLEAEWADRPGTYMHMLKTEFPDQWREMQLYGRRNISWSTIAPTGSLSMLTKIGDGFGTTSGLEPLFNVEPNSCWYVRRKKINEQNGERVDFVDDLGDRWTHFRVFHEGFNQWAKINHPDRDLQKLDEKELKALVEESPYGGSGSSEISWDFRVKIQAVLQKYISHSISSTVNLPENVSLETVSNIYFDAWKRGLKGITIYRDGSRSGVLVSESQANKSDQIKFNDAPKRPKQLPAQVHQLTALGERWTVFVGLLGETPYELFAIKTSSLDLSLTGVTQCFIQRKSRGVYNFIGLKGDQQISILDLASYMQTDDERADTRKYSLMLRHGVHPKYIVQQIDKAPGVVTSFNKSVARTLKQYISEEEQSKMVMKDCPQDGDGCQIVMQEGCATCQTCGKSKCS